VLLYKNGSLVLETLVLATPREIREIIAVRRINSQMILVCLSKELYSTTILMSYNGRIFHYSRWLIFHASRQRNLQPANRYRLCV
jgi:hypothetical protein